MAGGYSNIEYLNIRSGFVAALDASRVSPYALNNATQVDYLCATTIGFRWLAAFNEELTHCTHLATLYLQSYFKGKIPENTALSISVKT